MQSRRREHKICPFSPPLPCLCLPPHFSLSLRFRCFPRTCPSSRGFASTWTRPLSPPPPNRQPSPCRDHTDRGAADAETLPCRSPYSSSGLMSAAKSMVAGPPLLMSGELLMVLVAMPPWDTLRDLALKSCGCTADPYMTSIAVATVRPLRIP